MTRDLSPYSARRLLTQQLGEGNAVSMTYTLNGGYGSGVTVPGIGMVMNNEMDDFAAKPGVPNMFGLIQGFHLS